MATLPIGPNHGQSAADQVGRQPVEGAKQGKVEPAKGEGHPAARSEAEGRPASGEKVQISREAEDLLRMTELMGNARKALDEQPDLRADRVREVRERLKAGVYETRGVRDELAHRLSSILGDLPYPDEGSGR